jgi:catechol 2,3-dioxygenase-like lactoylglutathione lyase family enzyme
VQSWGTPPLLGKPTADPTQVGIQAIGFAVPDMAAAAERLCAAGCTVVGEGVRAAGPLGDMADWVTLRDTTGVMIDLRADDTVPADETRMRHLRITVSDLDLSLAWYIGLGFVEVARDEIADGRTVGADPAATAHVVRLRLPDEPFEAILVHWRDGLGHGRHTEHPNHAGLFRTAVGVDDTREAHDAMVADGIVFDRAPSLVELHGTPVPDMWICFLSDPDGVPFEFVERPRSAFR